jgi:hydroxymethylglutaryl-CoA lyase
LKELAMTRQVTVTEVGPRDGLQIARGAMPTEVKSRWIAALADAGVPEIEVGSFVPARVVPQMADTAEIVGHAVNLPGVTILALTPNLRGAQDAHAAGVHRIVVPVSVSEGHSQANLRRSPAAQVVEVGRIVAWLRAQPRRVGIEAACSTAFGCSIDGVVPQAAVLAVAEGLAAAGVDSLSLADTVGYANPAHVRSLVRAVRAVVGDRLQRLHLHDTMGLGLANALAGLEEGVRQFDSALAGLGGCPFAPGASGNIVTEDLVFMLESMGLSTGIDLERLIAARAILAEGLPEEKLRGGLGQAGIPRTFRPAFIARLQHATAAAIQ